MAKIHVKISKIHRSASLKRIVCNDIANDTKNKLKRLIHRWAVISARILNKKWWTIKKYTPEYLEKNLRDFMYIDKRIKLYRLNDKYLWYEDRVEKYNKLIEACNVALEHGEKHIELNQDEINLLGDY